jgi:hypothetical protein
VDYLDEVFRIGIPNLPSHPDPASPGSIFVVGSQFGLESFTNLVRAMGSNSMATKWLSDTLVNCKMASGLGGSRKVGVTTGAQMAVGSVTFAMSYNKASLSSFTYHSSLTNVLLPGSRTHAVSGDNLGLVDMTLGARLFGTADEGTLWSSDTSALAQTASGHQFAKKAPVFVLTAGYQDGSISEGLSYDTASISTRFPTNFPAVVLMESIVVNGTILIALNGINVGSGASSARASTGHSACDVSNWVSDSSLLTKLASGSANWKETTITIARAQRTLTFSLTYDVPRQSSLIANGPTARAYRPILLGYNFGKADYTLRGGIGGTSIPSTQWTSDTSVKIKPASGIMSTNFEAVMVLTVGVWCPRIIDQYGLELRYVEDCKVTNVALSSATQAYSYDLVAVSDLTWPGLRSAIEHAQLTSRGDSMMVAGSSFGDHDYSDDVRVGNTGAEASRWVSDTVIYIRFSNGVMGTKKLISSVGATATSTSLFSYYAPAILMPWFPLPASFLTNTPGTGAAFLFVHGAFFGHTSYTPKVRLSDTLVEASLWTSDSSISCRAGSGGGAGVLLQVTSGVLANSLSEIFSYDGPHPRKIDDQGEPSIAGGIITVLGSNYAEIDITQMSRFGPTACSFSKWHSTTAITCKRPAGVGAIAARDTIGITVIRQVKTLTTAFSYDEHSVQGTVFGNSPATGTHCISEAMLC